MSKKASVCIRRTEKISETTKCVRIDKLLHTCAYGQKNQCDSGKEARSGVYAATHQLRATNLLNRCQTEAKASSVSPAMRNERNRESNNKPSMWTHTQTRRAQVKTNGTDWWVWQKVIITPWGFRSTNWKITDLLTGHFDGAETHSNSQQPIAFPTTPTPPSTAAVTSAIYHQL